MAAHKNRSGALIVCFACKQGECGDCADMPDVVVCHCPRCQPTCGRPECQPHNVKGGKRKAQPPVCGDCNIAHAGDCF